MCGINGFNASNQHLIEAMNKALRHRGPDDEGVFIDDTVSLGHLRLSIIDLSPLGHQPMTSEDGSLVLVFNGEIYNFQELRELLIKKGYRFVSKTDSEVILHAYREFGVDCLNYFNGMFAFALWDKKEQQLFLARDRVGIKPLYYFWDGKRFIFSSELKALLEHPLERRVSREALNVYLRLLYVPSPLTMFEGINKLEPGRYLIYKNETVEVVRYWQPNRVPSLASGTAKQQMREILTDSVRLEMISDRPLGVFLSGGVDSTILAGIAAEQTAEPLQTFSVIYDVASEKFNADAALAKKTSERLKTRHHEIMVSGTDCREHLEHVVYHMDEPVANATQVATYLLSKHAKQHVAVALGGDGGDELFGGYERYYYSQLISRYQNMPSFVRHAGAVLIGSARPDIKRKLALQNGPERYLAFMAQKEQDIERFFLGTTNNPLLTPAFFARYYDAAKDRDPENDSMWTDIQSWLPEESLMRSDRMSMAFGLEQRVPFLDHRLVELSLRIPSAYKIRGQNKKAILKEVFAEYIPQEVLSQPKRGWFSPTSVWMRGPLKDMVYDIISPDFVPATREFFDFVALRRMLDDHIAVRAYHLNLLWAVIMFQLWYRTYIVRKGQ